jgi:hypothetical protein
LKVLDPERPIREADNPVAPAFVRYWVHSGHAADMAVFFSYLRLHHVGFLAAAAILKEAAW